MFNLGIPLSFLDQTEDFVEVEGIFHYQPQMIENNFNAKCNLGQYLLLTLQRVLN